MAVQFFLCNIQLCVYFVYWREKERGEKFVSLGSFKCLQWLEQNQSKCGNQEPNPVLLPPDWRWQSDCCPITCYLLGNISAISQDYSKELNAGTHRWHIGIVTKVLTVNLSQLYHFIITTFIQSPLKEDYLQLQTQTTCRV